ncbi:MAG: hypothetical protein AAFX95_27160, partial [Cyanobacteria bacterium J06639_16]
DGIGRKIELFVPDNPYFTTYQINEELYQLMQTVQRLQPQWQMLATPANRAYLSDLICKGLLRLSAERPRSIDRQKLEKLFSDPPLSHGIVELRTKTTPTCLSAYLNQSG